MSSPLPVPSKAALTALRGLVVGTSCTIALIAEDRRRKINKAMRAIENGERIKSAKSYRSGGAELVLAMEEEAMWEPALLPVLSKDLPLRPLDDAAARPESTERARRGSRAPRAPDVAARAVADAAEAESTVDDGVPAPERTSPANTGSSPSVAAPPVRPVHKTTQAQTASPAHTQTKRPPHRPIPSWALANKGVGAMYRFPKNDEIIARVCAACDSREPRQLGTALRTVLEAIDQKFAPDNLTRPWIEATALLCRTCQEEGRLGDAVKLLSRVVARGPLEESAYLSHNPLPLIEYLVTRTELSKKTRHIYLANLDTAVNLFLPTLTERPVGAKPELYSVGRRLLEACFSADRLRRTRDVYWRCNLMAGEESEKLASWFLKNLYEKHEYKSVVKVFLSTYAQTGPTDASVQAIGDIIVESVELAHNYKPGEVLQRLHQICASLGTTKLSPWWVTKLFVSHYKKNGDFQALEALFEELRSPTLDHTVHYPDNVYRIMVELALEAGEEVKAESYFAAAIAEKQSLASDIRLLGVWARFHAKDGDWEAVRADFEAMERPGESASKRKAYARVFVPVLKAYAETHTVRETEAFLKSYADELEVPLCNYTVTLMSKQYGAIRDVSSLIGWLDYCSRAGFSVDAAFTNSILESCRRQWKMPFRELRTLFRKMRLLNADFVDKHTEQIMADAALSDSRYGGKAAQGRLLSLRVGPTKAPARGKAAQAEDVVLAMKEAMTCGQPARALWIYKRALHLGMPYDQQALRLAVQARLDSAAHHGNAGASDDKIYEAAYQLIRDAQSKGGDIAAAVNYVLGRQLGRITSDTKTSETYDAVQQVLVRFNDGGIRLTEPTVHRAALTCLKAGHFRGAICFAQEAARLRCSPSPSAAGSTAGDPDVCFSLQNFRILLAAYAELVDADGLRDTVARALQRPYHVDTAVRRALRHARSRVRAAAAARGGGSSEQRARAAHAVLEEGLRAVVEARQRLREEGKQLEAEALRIMKQAALDAGSEPVNFADVPWLGGGKRAAGEAAGTGVAGWEAAETKAADAGDDLAFGGAGEEYGAAWKRELDGPDVSPVVAPAVRSAVEAF